MDHIEQIRNPRPDAVDKYCDLLEALDEIEGGIDFVDHVEDRVTSRDFYGGIMVDTNIEGAYAEAALYVAASLLRAGEFPEIRRAIADDFNISH